jgi:hypothetical protein
MKQATKPSLPGSQMQKTLFLIILLICMAISTKGQEPLSSDSLTVREILIEGNYVTSKKVIFRELDFLISA